MNQGPFSFALPEDEASRDRLAELGRIAASLVHELKNPLGALDLNVALLREQLGKTGPDGSGLDCVKALRRIDRAQQSSRHLHDIIQAFLAFARPGRPDPDRIDVNALLQELLEEQAEVLRVAQIEVHFHPQEDLLAVPADPRQLRSVFLNIIVNACDALQDKHEDDRRLVLVTRNRRHGIAVILANNGPLLSPHAAAHLFDPFYSEKENGTGLGLAIVRRLLELHGGSVSVSSLSNQGVSFTITLPTTLGPAQNRKALPLPEVEVWSAVSDAIADDPATRVFTAERSQD